MPTEISMKAKKTKRSQRLLGAFVAAMLTTVAVASVAFSASASAAVEWESTMYYAPTNLPPGETAESPGRGVIRILVANAGDSPSDGSPTVTVSLPDGVTLGDPADASSFWTCSGAQVVTCTWKFDPPFDVVKPFAWAGIPELAGFCCQHINLIVDVASDAQEGTFPVDVTISGGGGESVAQAHDVKIGREQPGFGASSFESGAFDESGAPYTQAGGHPFEYRTSILLNSRFVEPDPSGAGDVHAGAIHRQGSLNDVVVDLPPGLVGDATAVPQCRSLSDVGTSECPHSSQVGVVALTPLWGIGGGAGNVSPIYNVVPDKDAPAQFAFNSAVGIVALKPVLRSDGDMGLSVHIKNITQGHPGLISSEAVFWGVPADPRHDAMRCIGVNSIADACVGFDEGGQTSELVQSKLPHPSNAPVKPFLTLPTECSGQPLVAWAHVSSWEDIAAFEPDGDPDLNDPAWKSMAASSPPLTGCDKLPFNPSIEVRTTSSAPSSPSGLDLDLAIPQNENPDGVATAHLRDATVVLPDGMTVNPSSADGLDACGTAQIGLVSASPLRFTKAEPSCPLASKIGSVEVDTPLLDNPLTGSVFLARQGDNPFGSLLAMYMVVRGPGMIVKLAGHITADGQTGRLTTTMLRNPQLPFDVLKLRLKGGPRAPLATPSSCGMKAVTADLSSWSGQRVQATDSFSIDCPSVTGFSPDLRAGSTNAVAGAFSPFALRIDRSDRDQLLDSVAVKMPTGLLAKLRGVPLCANAQANAGTCGSASKVGSVVAGAGVGPTPYFLARELGSVYLTEGYKGAPYGLAVVVHALAGPFDLGQVVVRQALDVDRRTAQVTVTSDPLPRILQGIPLLLRTVQVDIDRSAFTKNPTSCAQKRIAATLTSQQGMTDTATTPFQVGDCHALAFKPHLSLRLTGHTQTRTGKHPGVRAVVTQRSGQAGIRRAEVRLPSALALDPDNAQALCEYKDGIEPDLERHCPKGSIVGKARAITPLLNRPLRGNVYFVKNIRINRRTGATIRTLPMLVVALRGEIALNLRGTASVKGKSLVSTFAGVPDAPLSRFDINIKGGRHGILVVTDSASGPLSVCGRQIARANMAGQNGRRYDRSIRVKTSCMSGSRRR
jgi:hypothetical protein